MSAVDLPPSPDEAPPRQLWLFAPQRPFVERFGHEFFRALPRSPGVYLMHGRAGRPLRERVLYVGKARNLFQRLGSYRHVHPDRDSRKTVRLVHAVDAITWEPCPDETAALLRENELLRQHRPLFNRINIRPEAYGCVGVQSGDGRIDFLLQREPAGGPQWYGAFKAGRRRAVAALLRLLHQSCGPKADWHQLPRPLLSPQAPHRFTIPIPRGSSPAPLLDGYFTGRSWELIHWLIDRLASLPSPEPFVASWREQDLETLRTFYLSGPRRQRRWKEHLNLPENQILRAEELDDLPVRVKLAPEPAPWPNHAQPDFNPPTAARPPA